MVHQRDLVMRPPSGYPAVEPPAIEVRELADATGVDTEALVIRLKDRPGGGRWPVLTFYAGDVPVIELVLDSHPDDGNPDAGDNVQNRDLLEIIVFDPALLLTRARVAPLEMRLPTPDHDALEGPAAEAAPLITHPSERTPTPPPVVADFDREGPAVTEPILTSTISVELLDWMGGDKHICEAARVSTKGRATRSLALLEADVRAKMSVIRDALAKDIVGSDRDQALAFLADIEELPDLLDPPGIPTVDRTTRI